MTESLEPKMRGAAITAWASALPDRVVTNSDFAAYLDTSDEWITERTGIRERRFGSSTSDLAVAAAGKALEAGGLSAPDIDVVIVATSTPDQPIPTAASRIAEVYGLTCGTFDVNAACAGFVYAMIVGNGMVQSGMNRALVVGAETMSRITNQDDRGTAVLFGDGAGAVVLESVEHEGQLLGFDFGTDGKARHLLAVPDRHGTIVMDGKEVFRKAVRATVDSANAAMEQAKVKPDDIALYVSHQANIRIIEATCNRLGLSMEKASIVLDRTGNTSAASIPIALSEAADGGRLNEGDLVLLSGFGAGMTWASAVWRWGR